MIRPIIIILFGFFLCQESMSFNYESKYGNGTNVNDGSNGEESPYSYFENLLDINFSYKNLFLYTQLEYSNSPIYGIIISSIIVSIFMLFNYSNSLVETFSYMMQLTTLAVTIPFLFSIMSLVLLLKKSSSGFYKKCAVAICAFAFTVWIITVFAGAFKISKAKTSVKSN